MHSRDTIVVVRHNALKVFELLHPLQELVIRGEGVTQVGLSLCCHRVLAACRRHLEAGLGRLMGGHARR